MASENIVIPELGEGVDRVEVVAVLVAVGDRIQIDQPLIEVETDKAAVEVPATASGTVTEVHTAVGDELTAGAPILTVEMDGTQDPASVPAPKEAETEAVAEAEAGAEAESRAESETEPESESEAEAEAEAKAETDAEAEARADAEARAETEHGSSAKKPPARREASAGESDEVLAPRWTAPSEPTRLVPAAPSVRRFAREVGIDIAAVTGSGPGGRLTIDDVKAHARRLLEDGSVAGFSVPRPELPDFNQWGPVEVENMSRIRRLTAENMSRAWNTAPQVTHNDLADITELDQLRQRYKGRVEAAGGKLTVTAILVKVVASALKMFPDLNSSIDMVHHTVIRKHSTHIGVAVDTPRGLLVPVIRDADAKNITEIAVELGDLAGRARKRQLALDEMQGGTFSISNLGGIGGTGFSPIVNWPEVAILGVSRGRIQPEWRDGQFEPRLMLPLSLSYDHRLVDGAQAARFLRWVAEALEQPLVLALEG